MKIRTTGATERVGDVPEELARELIRQGLAVQDTEKPKPKRRRAPRRKSQTNAPTSSA